MSSPDGPSREEERAARQRRRTLAPQLLSYEQLKYVPWPFVTVTARPDSGNEVVSIDTRGHRITRLGSETARSDDAPAAAGFVLGGSVAFGFGASDDSHTLAAALWRRTGVPYVNLAMNAASSTQELVSAIPFADRPATFVVFSGMNNLTRARAADDDGLDPLFGYVFGDRDLRVLASMPLERLARLVRDPLSTTDDAMVIAEARRRLAKRAEKRLGRPHKRPSGAGQKQQRREKTLKEVQAVVSSASAQQLRDLRILRRMVPDEATVVFALQPHALTTDRTPSPEEEEIFAALDLIQGQKWDVVREHIQASWADYAAAIERGCGELGVPFLDIAKADLEGWCFVDRAHLTDRGYDAAAAMLEQVVPHADRKRLREPLAEESRKDGNAGHVEPRQSNEPAEPLEADEAAGEDDPSVYPLW